MEKDFKNEMVKKVDDSKKEFAKRLRKRRRDLDMTLVEVADLVEVTHSYLSAIERGASVPSFEIIVKLSLALKMPVSWFLGEENTLPNGLTFEEVERKMSKYEKINTRLARLEELEKKEKELEQIKKIIGK